MGKRKLHNSVYYQCDWTGLPMASANCYMPYWTNADDKMKKRGTYCNWESVLAHANYLTHGPDASMSKQTLAEVEAHVSHVTGCPTAHLVHENLDFKQLEHFNTGVNMTADTYHAMCVKTTEQIEAVCISAASDTVQLVDIEPFDGVYDFKCVLNKVNEFEPYKLHEATISRPGKKLNKESELKMLYFAGTHPHCDVLNKTASQLAKQQIFGDVLLVQVRNELCFKPRVRYVDFNINEYNKSFVKKRKKVVPEHTPAMSTTEYDQVKESMQASLCAFEARASASAVRPQELSTAGCAVAPPARGTELAQIAEMKGMKKPKPPPRPPTAALALLPPEPRQSMSPTSVLVPTVA